MKLLKGNAYKAEPDAVHTDKNAWNAGKDNTYMIACKRKPIEFSLFLHILVLVNNTREC